MRRAVEWLLILAAALLVIGLIAYARGPKHDRGDEVGTHGTKIIVVHIVPYGQPPRWRPRVRYLAASNPVRAGGTSRR